MRGLDPRVGRGAPLIAALAFAFALQSVPSSRLLDASSLPGARGDIWVVDDAVRLDPVTGGLIEERHPSGAIDAAYRSHNPVWDETEGVIRIHAAANEIVAFQVVVSGGPHTGVSLAVSDLVGPATLSAAAHVRRHREWFLHVTDESDFCEFAGEDYVASLGPGWYPDPLIPLDEPVDPGYGQPFDIPQAANDIPGQTAAAFWVDVLVTEGTSPGTYAGGVTLMVDGEATVLPLELEVRGFALPAENHAGLGSVNYGGLAFQVFWAEPGAPNYDGLRRWYQMAHAHRLELDAHWIWPPWEDGVRVDWDFWRNLWRQYMTGTAFTDTAGYWGPNAGHPIKRFTLPQDFNWPVPDGDGNGRPDDPAFWQQSLRDLEGVMTDEGWTGVEAQLFVHPTDEPNSVADFNLIRYYGQLLEGTGLADRTHVTYRVDLGFFKNIDWVIGGWTAATIFSQIGPYVDAWNIVGSVMSLDVDAMVSRMTTHPEEQWWFYYSCCAGEPAVGSPTIEGEALGLRTWGWLMYRFHMQGAVTWEMDAGRNPDAGIYPETCWADPMCSGYGINGDAVLLYVGEPVGLPAHQPVASIRLKNMRRGSQDYEYLWLLEQADGNAARADSIAAALIPEALDLGLDPWDPPPGHWVHDPWVYDQARSDVGNLLDPAILAPVTDLACSISGTGIALTWSPVPGATGYALYVAGEPYFNVDSVAPVLVVGSSYAYGGAPEAGEAVFFVVRSRNGTMQSTDSNRVGGWAYSTD